jgi:hypothetical protein
MMLTLTCVRLWFFDEHTEIVSIENGKESGKPALKNKQVALLSTPGACDVHFC